MTISPTAYLVGGFTALCCGLDRTAALQVMISRPIVAAPLTGWLLGDAVGGLLVGALVELLWLGRLPVGVAIPPDDTQVAIGSIVLARALGATSADPAFLLLCLLVALPLGKAGQIFDRLARNRNGGLQQKVATALDEGNLQAVERCHLAGLVHFGLASLATYAVIVGAGTLLVLTLAPLLGAPLEAAYPWLRLAVPLVGVAVILGTISVSRAITLFGASFASALLMLWLL